MLKIPKLELPKGGGALKGIDETFQVNSSNGTASFTVPLPLSKARSDFMPALSLGYNSGSGTSVFGLGWSLATVFIQRKTDKLLPSYEDAIESDVFLLSGAEDLVPSLRQNDKGNWVEDEETAPTGERVKRYRPRVEGDFARIEKITPVGSRTSYWKVTSKSNVVTIYGRNAQAQIADPSNPNKIFKWLPELCYDDKGNCLEYSYVAEDLRGVPRLLSEGNRFNLVAPFVNTYLKRVKYGNKRPYYADPDHPYNPQAPDNSEYFFEMVLDYGDHDPNTPTSAPQSDWICRVDPFSEYKAGFDIRTYRLCQRILLFHYFKELNDGVHPMPCLVRSLDVDYRYFGNPAASPAELRNAEVDYPIRIRQISYLKINASSYDRKSLPPLEFTYQELHWNRDVQTIGAASLAGAPVGLSQGYQWVDLWSEGISGILSEHADAWFYKDNLGDGQFAVAQAVIPKPSMTGLSKASLQLLDLEADGRKFIVSTETPMRGYFELSDGGEWQPFQPFDRIPTISLNEPNTKLIDLNGDGRPDLVVSEEDVFTWYPSSGVHGYEGPEHAFKPFDEEQGPALVFSDPTSSIYLANMTGSGLTDIVRIRNGEVCYWPNLGYGRFGAKVAMNYAPVFDTQDMFNPAYLHLADVSGTGATDILYLGKNTFKAWLNQSGNAWTEEVDIDPFPTTELPNQLAVVDLLGNGTSCIVWSSPLPKYADAAMRYVDLMGGKKPYIMTGVRNNTGKEVSWEYRSSTYYYLQDKRAGNPWFTKLPFPVQCVSKVRWKDTVTRAYLTTEYAYHHGYYDHAEREYRGFGLVEQTDTETFDRFVKSGASNIVDEPLHQAPVLTKTWYHTGIYFGEDDLLNRYKDEYFQNPGIAEYHLPAPQLQGNVSAAQELREAQRACKSTVIRQETYGLDDIPGVSSIPYSVVERNCLIQMLQPLAGNRNAVFLVTESEAITYTYERVTNDPRVLHTLNIEIDQYGNVLQSAVVAYPRQLAPAGLPPNVQGEQQKRLISYTMSAYTNDITTATDYRLRQQCETTVFELTGVTPAGSYFTRIELGDAFAAASPIHYEDTPDGSKQKRQLKRSRTLYLKQDLSGPLLLGQMDALGLAYESYRLAFTQTLLTALYGTRVTPGLLGEGAYILSNDYKAMGRFPLTDPDGEWWIPSGTAGYLANAANTFYMPNQYIDPFGNATTVSYYADYQLLLQQVTDAAGNLTTAQSFDWRVLAPQLIQDINDNLTEARFDILGFVVGTALYGNGAEADDFTGFVTNLTDTDTANFFSDPATYGPSLLQHATSRFVYDFSTTPVRVGSIVRETHYQTAVASEVVSKLQYRFEYSNGFGSVAMWKTQTKPGLAKQLDRNGNVVAVDTTPHLRWVGSGRTVLNNKGKPVKQFEPYFSATHAYEDDPQLVEIGVSPLLYYDPVGRLIKTEYPNGTFSKSIIAAWRQDDFDQNDTVNDTDWYAERTTGSLAGNPQENQAALKASAHYDTPRISHLDGLGRGCDTVNHNRFVDHTTLLVTDEFYESYVRLDIEGNRREVHDARGNIVVSLDYDILGNDDHSSSMDAGDRWMLNDCMGKPIYGWDSKSHVFHTTYDALRRPTQGFVQLGAIPPILYDQISYGEGQPNDKALNLRGVLVRHADQAGVTTNTAYDFKGNLLETTRAFVQLANYEDDVDWSQPQSLQTEVFTTQTQYDALSRPVRVVEPNSNPAVANVSTPTYNESVRLQTVDVFLRGAVNATRLVSNIDYNEKGQRTRIDYGNGASTVYKYDDLTFRLIGMVTARGADPELFWDDKSNLTKPAYASKVLQFLTYTFDPVGKITYIRDDAQQVIYFNNARVDPSCDYTYDATYRLTDTIGREHIGQHWAPDPSDSFRMGNPQPGDSTQMQTYTQQYDYDHAGNMLLMHNVGSWRRTFTYAATNNQMLTADPGGAVGPSFIYSYDEHGNMKAMPHLQAMHWDFKDRLRYTEVSAAGIISQQSWYRYDGGVQRARKRVQKGAVTEERLYVGTVEVYRRYRNGALELERETLHVTDDTRRIAMVDTPTVQPVGGTETQLIRYQFGNHLDTACLELDDAANIISYEEYYAFGSTSYQATNQTREIPAKRYRYTGKERDEESGLYYHGARYYAPWLARWTAPDPAGTDAGLNLYAYANDCPTVMRDPNGRQADEPEVIDRSKERQPDVVLVKRLDLSTVAPPDVPDLTIIKRLDLPPPNPKDAGSSANLQYLTNGNPPGGATLPGRAQSEWVGSAGLTLPHFPRSFGDASAASSQTVASRAGLFLTQSGLGAEYGIVASGSLFVPTPLSLQLTLHIGDPHFGLYGQFGQLSDPTGRNLGLIANLNVAQGATWNENQSSLYVNEILNQASSGSVANKDVSNLTTGTLLVGGAYSPNQGPNAFGGEASATYSTGSGTGGTGQSSFTATGLLFYTRAFNNQQNIFGVALGASYETGGGGFTGFLRIGIGLDRPVGQSTALTGPYRLPLP